MTNNIMMLIVAVYSAINTINLISNLHKQE